MKVFRPPLRRSWIRHWCGVFESTSTYIGGILTGLLTLLSAKRSLIGACVAFSWPDALPDVKPMVQSSSFPISLISSSLPHFPSWVLTSYLCNFATKKILFPSGVLYIYCLFFVTSPFVYILGSLLIQFLLIPMDLYWLLTHFPCRFRSEPGSRNMKRSLIRCRFFLPHRILY